MFMSVGNQAHFDGGMWICTHYYMTVILWWYLPMDFFLLDLFGREARLFGGAAPPPPPPVDETLPVTHTIRVPWYVRCHQVKCCSISCTLLVIGSCNYACFIIMKMTHKHSTLMRQLYKCMRTPLCLSDDCIIVLHKSADVQFLPHNYYIICFLYGLCMHVWSGI